MILSMKSSIKLMRPMNDYHLPISRAAAAAAVTPAFLPASLPAFAPAVLPTLSKKIIPPSYPP